jgi:3-keto-disaccharide hydrolase
MTNRLAGLVLMLAISCCPALAKKGKWQVLFDGKSIDAWRGFRQESFPDQAWKVEGETLKTVAGAPSHDIVTKEKYANFELELEWKIAAGGNSGIIYLVSEDFDQTWKTGPEMQVLDDARHSDGKDPKTSAGALYALIAPVHKVLKPVGEWNMVRIIVLNGHVEHWLNGRKIVEYDLGSDQLKPLIAASKFKEFPRFGQNREGFVALQHHGDEVWYRKIRIRSL